jgi:hypothetical protein
MNPSPRKWHARKAQPVEVGLIQVNIGGHSRPFDRFADLIVKRAKEILKDDLIRKAEYRGGKLASWEEDAGTFLFMIEGPDSLNNCCQAAIEMLEQLPSVKAEVQLSPDLEHLLVIRIACDTGTATCDAETHALTGGFVDEFKQYEQAVSAENKVTITERVFQRLNKPLKSRFVKWKHSTELGVDLYSAAAAPGKSGHVLAGWSAEQATPQEDQPTPQAGPTSTESGPQSSPGRWLEVGRNALRSRKVLGIGAVVFLALLVFGLVRFLAWQPSPPPVPRPQAPEWPELVQSPEWRTWREQAHEKLSAGEVTEKTLAEALMKLPPRPEQAPAALRRDQAIGDVLMSYPAVKTILLNRFGIYEDGFLGTGLSKPCRSSNYGEASVHEYLIPNIFADESSPVWTRTLDPINHPDDLRMEVQELFDSEKATDRQKAKVKEIRQRVKAKDSVLPAVIRFGRFDAIKYSRKLGPPDRYRVFASNLAEVWDKSVRDAADLSGYTFDRGDTVYIWVFLPNHTDEVVPATWDRVLNNLPRWIAENQRN